MKHRSPSAWGAALVLLSATALIAACGGEDDRAATAKTTNESADAVLIANFKRCPSASDAEFSASGWAASVAGDVSCDEAGSLIQHHFLRDLSRNGPAGSQAVSIRKSDPGRYASAGYDCATFPLPSGLGWHALCATPDAQVSFYITP